MKRIHHMTTPSLAIIGMFGIFLSVMIQDASAPKLLGKC